MMSLIATAAIEGLNCGRMFGPMAETAETDANALNEGTIQSPARTSKKGAVSCPLSPCPARPQLLFHKKLRLVFLQCLAGCCIGVDPCGGFQVREQLQNLDPLRVSDTLQRVVAGLEALCPGAVR